MRALYKIISSFGYKLNTSQTLLQQISEDFEHSLVHLSCIVTSFNTLSRVPSTIHRAVFKGFVTFNKGKASLHSVTATVLEWEELGTMISCRALWSVIKRNLTVNKHLWSQSCLLEKFWSKYMMLYLNRLHMLWIIVISLLASSRDRRKALWRSIFEKNFWSLSPSNISSITLLSACLTTGWERHGGQRRCGQPIWFDEVVFGWGQNTDQL